MIAAAQSSATHPGLAMRAGRLVVLGILFGIGIGHIYWAIVTWPLNDMHVYLDAATRLRDGGPLYVPGDVGRNSFWYAPWYAVAWIPLTHLPREVVSVAWSAALLVATGAVAILLVRMGRSGQVLALLVVPALFAVSAGGNIQAPMLLALLVGLHRRWGPIAVAGAASLKLAPILLVLVYVARRDWTRVLLTLAATAILVIPSILMGLVAAGPRSELAPSLLGISPILYVLTIAVVAAAAVLLPPRYSILAAAAAVILALPRLYVYDVTAVVVGTASPQDAAQPVPGRSRRS